jgi:hypothetical protein
VTYFAFAPDPKRVVELIRDGQPEGASPDNDDYLANCDGASHRRLFFADIGAVLNRRGQPLWNGISDCPTIPRNELPGKAQLQAFCENRPVSLLGIVKIDAGLTQLGSSNPPAVAVTVGNAAYRLPADSVVPSIYYAIPSQLKDYRRSLPYGQSNGDREKLSVKIFGHSRWDILRLMEDADASAHPRITRATLDRMADVMGDEVYRLFTTDHDAGPKNGDLTYALLVSQGNKTRYTRVSEEETGKLRARS